MFLLGSPCSVHEVAKNGTEGFVYWKRDEYMKVIAESNG